MKIVSILLNIFLCPIGTFVVGKAFTGIVQLILIVIAFFLTLTGIGAVVGVPLAIIVWIWGLIIVIQYKPNDAGIQRFG